MRKLILATLFLSVLAGGIGIGLGLFLQAQARKNLADAGGTMADGSTADVPADGARTEGSTPPGDAVVDGNGAEGSAESHDDTASTPHSRSTPVVMSNAEPSATRRRTVASSASSSPSSSSSSNASSGSTTAKKKKTTRTNTTIDATDPGDPGEASLLDALSDGSLPVADESSKGASTVSMKVAKAELAFPASAGGVSIKKVTQKQQGPSLEIIIEFTGAVPKHKVFRVKNPARIYVDFEQLEIPGGDKTAPGAGGRVKEIGVRAMTGADSITRVQIRLDDAGDVLPKVSESATDTVLTLVIAPNTGA